MALIRIDRFGGLAPIFDPRKLPDYGAVIARDGKFDGGDFRPLYAHKDAQQPLGFAVSHLFKYRFQGDSRWLAWPDPWDVDVVASPIPQDDLGRIYWTRVNPNTLNDDSEDNYPRAASQPTQSNITSGTPSVVRRLGVPKPAEAPTIAENKQDYSVTSVADPATITQMSQTSPVTVTAPGHKMEEGWTVVVGDPTERDTPPMTPPPRDQGGIETDDRGMAQLLGNEYVVGAVTADTFDLRGSDGSNYNAFNADTTNIKISRVYDDADMETRSYVFTFVTDWGEEGPPSPPSDPRDIRYDSGVTITCPKAGGAWAADNINRVRIYRTATGTQSTDFYYVGEITLDFSAQSTDFTDDVESISLGELIPSITWAAPINGLHGMVAMPNGFLAAFKGNTVYFSEPYMPHAWPDEYRKTVQDDIVGIAVYGQTLIVATMGKPYLGTGVDPSSVSLAQLDIEAPCLSKGGMASIGAGVVYPTPDGLAFVSAGNVQIITQNYVNKRQWAELWSDTMDAIYHDQRYIAFSKDTSKRTLIVERRPDMLAISDTDTFGRAPALDQDTDELNFILVSGSNQRQRWIWEGGNARGTGVWKSKVFTLPHATSLAMGQLYAEGYPVTLTVRYANLQANGQPLGEVSDSYEITVAGPEPFRLPGGFLSREYQAEVSATSTVQGLFLADNADELRQV